MHSVIKLIGYCLDIILFILMIIFLFRFSLVDIMTPNIEEDTISVQIISKNITELPIFILQNNKYKFSGNYDTKYTITINDSQYNRLYIITVSNNYYNNIKVNDIILVNRKTILKYNKKGILTCNYNLIN